MLNTEQLYDILEEVTYKDWEFFVGGTHEDPYLQVQFRDAEGEEQHGRKWRLSYHMTKSEVVTTALKAVLTAEEHEAREQFRYRGVRIFGPHIHVDVLADVARARSNLDLREEN
jgi:hypothetical protein